MTDRELLELAAKAAGRKVFSYIDDPIFGVGMNDGETDSALWNPLTDDGDALRLAVKLDMDVFVEFGESRSFASTSGDDGLTPGEFEENTCSWMGDKGEAVRRAIVRAAAEIGKGMP